MHSIERLKHYKSPIAVTYGFIYRAVIELTQFKEITEHAKPKRENRTTSFHNRTYEQECRVKKSTYYEHRRFFTI